MIKNINISYRPIDNIYVMYHSKQIGISYKKMEII